MFLTKLLCTDVTINYYFLVSFERIKLNLSKTNKVILRQKSPTLYHDFLVKERSESFM